MSEQPRSFSDTHPHLREFAAFLEDFGRETERGAALAAAAMLDDLLGRVLGSFMIRNKGGRDLLEGFNAPLGSFSARIAASFACGLISEAEYKECELIRKIRNEFAHQISVSFKSQKIAGLCGSLKYSAQSYGSVHVDERGQFTTAAVALILNLTNRPHYVGQKRLQVTNWAI
ncbi:transcriptional regulator [Achromobacter xylosoxidans]|uniref:transcriptional regulator n=1 Tax=Alcaligenes xylosoxydans xylosoxydans TaxID=85698 RepID=UPI0009E730AD|nr:transcriptional regulator [Achromobacter xylosoxidans]